MSSSERPGATFKGSEALAAWTAADIVGSLASAPRAEASKLIAELMRRFSGLTHRIWLGAGGPPDEYDDFRQTVWLKLLDQLPRLERPEAFPGFFRQLALRHAIDEVRKVRGRDRRFIPLDEEALPDFPVQELEGIDNAILVRTFLEALPGKERAVLQLLFEQDRTTSEAAEILGLTEGAVRMTKSRGINRLRGLLQVEGAVQPKARREG